ncbi:MAG TPA: hypothetical protein VE944_13010 [Nostoc sp.]|nr:hypothetical protein [Nostoc sp.]HYX15263.1 hypothetical protein [Nostoc sp.]
MVRCLSFGDRFESLRGDRKGQPQILAAVCFGSAQDKFTFGEVKSQ